MSSFLLPSAAKTWLLHLLFPCQQKHIFVYKPYQINCLSSRCRILGLQRISQNLQTKLVSSIFCFHLLDGSLSNLTEQLINKGKLLFVFKLMPFQTNLLCVQRYAVNNQEYVNKPQFISQNDKKIRANSLQKFLMLPFHLHLDCGGNRKLSRRITGRK